MTPAFSFLANHLWQSTLFAGAVWLIALGLKSNRASVRYWLWFTASLKFLVPFSLLIGIGGQIGAASVPAISPDVSAMIQQVSEPFTGIPLSPAPGPAVTRVPESLFEHLATLIAMVWLCGTLGVLLSWCSRWRRISVALRSAKPFVAEGSEGIDVMSSSAALEPGVVGIVRPVLLLPAGIEHLLDQDQLRSIIVHEAAHIRRRDNLAAALHMLVEAAFWFHPLVWWMGARLVDERERACDEEVLRMGSEPRAYAEGILKVCRFYLQSRLVCAAGITSSNLRRRIEEIMQNRMARQLGFGRKLILAVAGAVSIAGPLAIGVVRAPRMFAEIQTPGPGFEVASVKSNNSGSNSSRSSSTHERVTITNETLAQMIQGAYRIRDYQVSGPAWIKEERFDVVAKAESGTPDSQLMPMLQALLADRFKLKFHRETKQLPIYALVVGKNGSKLKEAVESDASGSSGGSPAASAGGSAGPASGGPRMATHTSIGSLSGFVGGLSRSLDRPVLDMTGLTGRYDIKLVWSPETDSLFTVIQEELGLRLEARNGPVEVFVIDSVERPSEGAQAAPAFEAASIKVNAGGGGPGSRSLGCKGGDRLVGDPTPLGRCVVRRMNLRIIAAFAYGIPIEQMDRLIVGGPGWVDSDQYDIEAKAGESASAAQLQRMLQGLLADRFKLAFHRDKLESSGYALVATPGGPRLPEAKNGDAIPSTFIRRSGTLTIRNASVTDLAAALSTIVSSPVVNNTELKGSYDITLNWSPDESAPRDPSAPAIFTAVQEQLGLKLESRKNVSIEVLVIDHAERPIGDFR